MADPISSLLRISRRSLLASTAAFLSSASSVRAATVSQGLPWGPNTATPPVPVRPGPWVFFTADEAAIVEAAVDRLIPPDERGPGGKDAGCAVFIDRQLAGPFGRSDGLYMKPPFMPGAATQGYQLPDAPAARYRAGLKALAAHINSAFAGQIVCNALAAGSGQGVGRVSSRDRSRSTASTPHSSSLCCWRTRSKDFLRIRSMAAIGTWPDGSWLDFPVRDTTIAIGSSATTNAYPLPPVSIMGRSDWSVRE